MTWLDAPASADESCYIDTVLGAVSVLRAIAVARTRVAAYIENGATLVHTTLLGVQERPPVLFFEKGPDAVLSARLLGSDKIVFVTSDQGVPVQFTCPTATLGCYNEHEAFKVTLPGRVLRLQRRSYYRLPGDPAHVLPGCDIVVAGAEDAAAQVLKPELLDLSCGGLGAAMRAADSLLAPGTLSECTLKLPGIGRIETLVEVRAATDILLPNGVHGRRYGLVFVNLAAKSAAAIQRYILEQQRARKKLTT